MAKTKVYIDGQSGTTGLQIHERISSREDLSLMRIPEELRHDTEERKKYLNDADIVFLCLPDDGAREAVALIGNPHVRVIDASTAHRTSPDWTYGFPELSPEQREAIAGSHRVANPGCHATGFISCTAPLVRCGILPADYPLTCYSLTGYSGGGKKMIAGYESPDKDPLLCTPGIYGLSQTHKHLPEMQMYSGLSFAPAFHPIVDDYYKGMATTILLHNRLLNGTPTAGQICECLESHYGQSRFVHVRPYSEDTGPLYAGTLAGTNRLELIVTGNEDRTAVTALFDNLGKGASGAAVQNMNIMLGMDEGLGLE